MKMTRKQFIEELPQPYREQAELNIESGADMDEVVENLELAITGCFDTEETRQGFKYWYDVINKYGAWKNDLRTLKSRLDIEAERFADEYANRQDMFNTWSHFYNTYRRAYYSGAKNEFGSYENCQSEIQFLTVESAFNHKYLYEKGNNQ